MKDKIIDSILEGIAIVLVWVLNVIATIFLWIIGDENEG